MKKVAIVTGSARGIGRAIADALWDDGYLAVYSDVGATRPEHLSEDKPYIQCDISDSAMRAYLIAQTVSRYGRIDVLVNNAGVAPAVRMDVLDTTEENFDRVLDINLRGTFFLCQLAASAMLARLQQEEEGYRPRICNITSISAYTSSVNRAEYCIAKAGLSMVTKVFADRLAEAGIPVFEIQPGIIETNMTSGVLAKYNDLIAEGLLPIPRMGKPRDVANVVLAACSGLLDYSTGQVLCADGGFHIRRL